ncbi:endolytic transglycosylase MltG [Enterococcus timonensis]|uniref:endolytic transglycosylase MltG n=1 Tax=Enterococcus timonensis TaxID=1852364 RepID=UPI0008DA8358
MPTSERKKKVRQKENVFVRRIVAILILVFVVVLLIGGISFWNFWQSGQKPLDTANSTTELVEIPLGSSNKQIGAVLEENKIIKSAVVFNYYMKLHNQSGFQAGFYDLAPNMTLDQIASTLKAGDTVQQTLLIPEGYTIDQIGTAIEENTPYTKQDFMEVINDEAFFQAQLKKFPELLQSAADATDTRYHLEGYLFPATYTLTPGGEIDGLVAQMVQKSADVLSNYYDEIATRGITVQQMLTLASLTEKEGSKDEDRRNIAQVFYNRLAIDMPLQSDISVLYALDEHKELLTIEDTQVDSPYNLYANRGYGPGPFNSPSEASIQAVLYPQANDYYYFVADITTGIVYYARTLDEHNQLVAQYVNN